MFQVREDEPDPLVARILAVAHNRPGEDLHPERRGEREEEAPHHRSVFDRPVKLNEPSTCRCSRAAPLLMASLLLLRRLGQW